MSVSALRDAVAARFLRGINSDIGAFIAPNLTSGDALERAAFTQLVLARFAEDHDTAPQAAADLGQAFEAGVKATLATLRGVGLAAEADALSALAGKAEAPGTPAATRISLLREALGEGVRRLSGVAPGHPQAAEVRSALDAVLALEQAWLEAKTRRHPAPETAGAAGPSVYDRVTPQSVTDYLRGQFPETPKIAATKVEVLPGGRSKKTIFIALENAGPLPERVVMRQDTGMAHIPTHVADEFPLLNAVTAAGVPAPGVCHLEPGVTALGGPFLLMRRLSGKPTGSYGQFDAPTPALLKNVAEALAGLHALDPRELGLAADDRPHNVQLRDLVMTAWAQWRAEAVEPSPIFEYGFDWMLRQCERPLAGGRIVHGDYRPHNFLGEGDQLTGILDWEFAHAGDAAEDLAYIRGVITPHQPWETFMGHYTAAGGQPCDEADLNLYEIWGLLRLAAMGAGAVRQYLDGRNDDFTSGAGGFFVVPIFEQQLADLLKAARALGRP